MNDQEILKFYKCKWCGQIFQRKASIASLHSGIQALETHQCQNNDNAIIGIIDFVGFKTIEKES